MIANKYKIYNNKKKSKKLHELCNSAACIWNHTLALHRRYYFAFGKSVPKKRMRQQIAKLRNNNKYWGQLNSQTVQEVVDRVYESYDRFFKGISKRPPKFKKWSQFSSFVFTQSGWKIEENELTINKILTVKFFKSRDYYDIKNIRIKRDSVGDWWVIITSSKGLDKSYKKTYKGAFVGFDFSLPKFLIGSDGMEYDSPLFYYKHREAIAKLSKQLSKKKKGSKNYYKKRKELSKLHRKLANKRRDHHFKLSHELCDKYSFISLETLNIEGMKQLWGKKISDLSFSSFVNILKHVASSRGVIIHEVDKWFASSKTCSDCGFKNNKIKLSDREWSCSGCGTIHDRDKNASLNILRQGIVEYRSKSKTPNFGASYV